MAGGHVQTNEELYTGRSSRQPNRVFRNLGDGTTWPGGRRQVLENVGADRLLEVREPAAR